MSFILFGFGMGFLVGILFADNFKELLIMLALGCGLIALSIAI